MKKINSAPKSKDACEDFNALVLRELASLSPKIATEAALTLLSSSNKEMRDQGASLGAWVASRHTGKGLGTKAMVDFCSKMLSEIGRAHV